jgi:hypothetical protein
MNTNAGSGCFSIGKIKDEKMIIKNQNERVNSEVKNNKISIESSGNFYYIYFSNILNPISTSLTGCIELNESDYQLGMLSNIQAYDISKFNELKLSYNSNYEGLKQSLGLANNFGFIIKDTSGAEIINAVKKPENVNIKASEIPIQIVNSDADIIPMILSIQAWS